MPGPGAPGTPIMSSPQGDNYSDLFLFHCCVIILLALSTKLGSV